MLASRIPHTLHKLSKPCSPIAHIPIPPTFQCRQARVRQARPVQPRRTAVCERAPLRAVPCSPRLLVITSSSTPHTFHAGECGTNLLNPTVPLCASVLDCEQFRNCADIVISPFGNTASSSTPVPVPTPVPAPAPVPAPVPTPVPAPVPASSACGSEEWICSACDSASASLPGCDPERCYDCAATPEAAAHDCYSCPTEVSAVPTCVNLMCGTTIEDHMWGPIEFPHTKAVIYIASMAYAHKESVTSHTHTSRVSQVHTYTSHTLPVVVSQHGLRMHGLRGIAREHQRGLPRVCIACRIGDLCTAVL